MYRVEGDGIMIYNDVSLTESMKATGPKLTLKDNSAGTFEITLPPGNAGYDKLQRLKSCINIYRDDMEIWSGRIITEKKDFWNNRILTCEGELAYLNDSIQPPAKFSEQNVRQFLSAILEVHNSKVGDDKKFTVGAVTVKETVSIFTNNENTFTVISEQLINKYGGHLRVRKVDGIRYLDYLKDWPSTNTQEVRFGQNLLDFTREWDATSFATAVMPRGAKLEESPIPELEAYVDVSSVNGGSCYVTNEEGIEEFGWIAIVVEWEDITDPSELLAKAKEYLENQQFDEMVLEVSAVDLRYLGITTDSITLLDEVRCISRPHGLNRTFPVSELTIQLDNPENSTYILGSETKTTLTNSVKEANSSIIKKIDSKPTTQQILQSAKDNATQIINSATRGYVTIVKSSKGTESMVISSDLTYNPNNDLWSSQTKLWRWNINGLGYSTDGGQTYGTAITMDGGIYADYITLGTLTTVLIRDVDGNSSWDLSTGEFTMKKGSISLGISSSYPDGRFRVNDDGEIYAEYGEIGGFRITSYSIYNDVIDLSNVGLTMKRDNVDIGKFGTNSWTGYPSHRGLVMDLENPAHYISWAWKETASASEYTVKLLYASRQTGPTSSGFKADRVHLGCNLDGNDWLAESFWIDATTGGVNNGVSGENGQRLPVSIPASINSQGVVTKWYDCYIRNGVLTAS